MQKKVRPNDVHGNAEYRMISQFFDVIRCIPISMLARTRARSLAELNKAYMCVDDIARNAFRLLASRLRKFERKNALSRKKRAYSTAEVEA